MDPTTGPELPGYSLGDRLGEDRWLARQQVSGRLVVLRWVRADLERVRRSCATVSRLPTSTLLGARALVDAPDGLVVVSDHVPGGSLRVVLDARGRLAPGEVVTVGAALADALAALHPSGVAHGDVSADTVLLGLDGVPVLVDAGVRDGSVAADLDAARQLCVAALLGTRSAKPLDPSDADGSVQAVFAALTEQVDGPAGLGSALRAATPAVPVRVSRRAAPDALPPRPGRSATEPAAERAAVGWRRPWAGVRRPARRAPQLAGSARGRFTRWVGIVAGSLLALIAAVVVGLLWGRSSGSGGSRPLAASSGSPSAASGTSAAPSGSSSAAAGPSAAPSGSSSAASGTSAAPSGSPSAASGTSAASSGSPPTASGTEAAAGVLPGPNSPAGPTGPVSWRAVLSSLDTARAAAFVRGGPAAFLAVDLPGSPAWRRDTAASAALRGATPRGLRFDVVEAVPVSGGPSTVVLVVTDRMPRYDLTRGRRITASVPARGMRTWRVTVGAGPGGWRYFDAQPL